MQFYIGALFEESKFEEACGRGSFHTDVSWQHFGYNLSNNFKVLKFFS